MTSLARHARRTATIVAAVGIAACVKTPDAILSVTDPDIINPTDVQSAAGANAVRLGALNRLTAATTGGEGLIQLGGLLADEWRSGDTFVDRDQIDRRVVIRENAFATTANRTLHRARLSASQALDLLRTYNTTAPGWHLAEMYFVQAYVENLMAEHYCSGMIFSRVVNGVEQYGSPVTTTAALNLALAHADSGIALITGTTTDDVRVRGSLEVTRGRILMNLNQPGLAGTAVVNVLTSFRRRVFHSTTTTDNSIWALNNSARRYNLSSGEGGAGLDFVTPNDPRVPSCLGGSAACTAAGATQPRTFDNNTTPVFRAQLLWAARDSSVAIVSGVEARLIEAEAALRVPTVALFVQKLNQARTEGGVAGLAANLTDPGSTTTREDLLFRERAFWNYGKGHRLGDLRRLMRQYLRTEIAVFPTGAFHKGGVYGTDVNFSIPQAEDNNPNAVAGTCIDRLP